MDGPATETIESSADVAQRVLKGLIAIDNRKKRSKLSGYADEKAAIEALFETVPPLRAKALLERLEPPRDAFGCYLFEKFAATRTEGLRILLNKAGLPDRKLAIRTTATKCPGANEPHVAFRLGIEAQGLHLPPLTDAKRKAVVKLTQEVSAAAANSLLTRLKRNKATDDFSLFLHRNFPEQIEEIKAVLEAKVRAIRTGSTPPKKKRNKRKTQPEEKANQPSSNIPPFSHANFVKGVDLKKISVLQHKLWPVQDAFVLHLFSLSSKDVLARANAPDVLKKANITVLEMQSDFLQYRQAFADMTAGLAKNTLKHQRRIIQAWSGRFASQDVAKAIAEDPAIDAAAKIYAKLSKLESAHALNQADGLLAFNSKTLNSDEKKPKHKSGSR